MSLGEYLHKDNPNELAYINGIENKKNRVTAARSASYEAPSSSAFSSTQEDHTTPTEKSQEKFSEDTKKASEAEVEGNEAVEENLAKRSKKYNALADKRDNMERFTLDEFNFFYKRRYGICRNNVW